MSLNDFCTCGHKSRRHLIEDSGSDITYHTKCHGDRHNSCPCNVFYPFPLGRYRHFKGGEYVATEIGFNSENLIPTVRYVSQADGVVWYRPVTVFLSEVDRDGYKGPRFIYKGPE